MDQTQIYIYIHISLETFRIGSKEELPFWSSSFTTDASLLHSKTTRSPCKPLKPKQGCSSRATDHTCGCRHSPKSRLLVVALPTATCQHADVTQVAAWHRTEVTHFTAQQWWPPCNLVPPPYPSHLPTLWVLYEGLHCNMPAVMELFSWVFTFIGTSLENA